MLLQKIDGFSEKVKMVESSNVSICTFHFYFKITLKCDVFFTLCQKFYWYLSINPSNFSGVSKHNLVAEAAEVSMINACIKACATASEWSKALHLFSLIKKPNFFYLDPLVRACSKSKAWVQAGGIWMTP